jgi:hypothetical protein
MRLGKRTRLEMSIMSEISLKETAPLEPFRIPIRHKEQIKALLYKLEVPMLGWNLPILFHKYCIGVDEVLSEEHHRMKLIKLTGILISGDNAELINNPFAVYDDEIDVDRLFAFLLNFINELQNILCDTLDVSKEIGSKPVFGTRTHARELHCYMTSIVYSKIVYRNPAIPGIVAFLLLVLANIYRTSLCKTPTGDIVMTLVSRIGLKPVPLV